MIKSNLVRRFLKDSKGANLVEYTILVGMVALISIAAFKLFGSAIQNKIKGQGTTVDGINAGAGS